MKIRRKFLCTVATSPNPLSRPQVKSPLIMKAFAFEAGDAKVSYEWGYTRTPKCLGILPNTGTMESSVTKNGTVAIGEVSHHAS